MQGELDKSGLTPPYAPQQNVQFKAFKASLTLPWETRYSGIQQLKESKNNKHNQASIAYLGHKLFWQVWNEGKISCIGKEKIKLSLSSILFDKHFGKWEPEGSLLLKIDHLNGG